ncbi:hypothetical protein [Peterkaempfera bronchialis]|uniref:hypothetical protein n=1 Tax=Peterkaempfera bronchialis TaxID=2126346 RepID=UPI003C30D02A
MSSRETDNASPSPRRNGGDAYPSGTPPYGIPQATGAFGPDGFAPEGVGPDGYGPDGGAAEDPAADDGPKTETTLTTRIRINIPGSRPIPPVVVRSPVKDADAADQQPPAEGAAPGRQADGSRRRAAGPGSPVLGVMDAENRTSTPPNLPPEWQTPEGGNGAGGSPASAGEWFRPRKKGGPAGPAAGPAPAGGAPVPPPASPAPDDFSAPPRTPGHPAFEAPATHPEGGGPQQRGPQQGGGAQRQSGGGSIPRPGGPQGGPRPSGVPATPFAPPTATPPGQQGPGQGPGQQGHGHGHTQDDAFPGAVPQQPAPQPTAGPFPPGLGVRSRPAPGPLPQQGGGAPATPYDGFQPDYGNAPYGTGPAGAPQDAALAETAVGGFPPVADPGPGETTAAFPAAAFPPPGAPLPAGQAEAQGNTFAAGFRNEDFRPAAHPAAAARPPAQRAPVTVPVPVPDDAEDDAPAAAPRRRRGRTRKLLIYAVAAVVCAAGVAYGAGLMLNQSDVPKGITVLGTDIGGSSRDAAVHTLDSTVAKIGREPIQLRLGGKAVALDPAAAGLSFDTTATVDLLTQHSYNPVDVMDSLTGNAKAVPPLVKIDPAKLRAALEQLGSQAGQGPREGYVSFTAAGAAVVVPPKAGKAVDVESAVVAVQQSYQARALGQKTAPIELKVTEAQPKASAADLQAAADGLGKQIVSGGNVIVKRGPADYGIPFGLASFSLSLRLAPDADGKVVPSFDLAKLEARSDGAFNGYQMKHGSTVGPVTTRDVADAIISALDKTGAARTVVLPVVTG